MNQIDRASATYAQAIQAATDRAESTNRTVQGRLVQVRAAAEKLVADAERETEGVEQSAVETAEKAIGEATRKLDQALASALGAPPNARIIDAGQAMNLYLGDQLVATAGPASGSYLVTFGSISEGHGSWTAARVALWRGASSEAEKTMLARVSA
jgi:hypothetical protein